MMPINIWLFVRFFWNHRIWLKSFFSTADPALISMPISAEISVPQVIDFIGRGERI